MGKTRGTVKNIRCVIHVCSERGEGPPVPQRIALYSKEALENGMINILQLSPSTPCRGNQYLLVIPLGTCRGTQGTTLPLVVGVHSPSSFHSLRAWLGILEKQSVHQARPVGRAKSRPVPFSARVNCLPHKIKDPYMPGPPSRAACILPKLDAGRSQARLSEKFS